MEIAFENEKLRELCRSDARLRSAYGPEGAQIVKSVIADFKAADSIYIVADSSVLPAGLRGERVVMQFGEGLRMEVIANHRTNPSGKNGMVDWTAVYRIKIAKLAFE